MVESRKEDGWILALLRQHPALLASLKEPITWVIVIVSVLITMVDNKMSHGSGAAASAVS